MNQTTINQLHREKNGKFSNKWTSYPTYYDALFKPLCHQPINLLEICVQNGGSLETWSTNFTRAQRIVGREIDRLHVILLLCGVGVAKYDSIGTDYS